LIAFLKRAKLQQPKGLSFLQDLMKEEKLERQKKGGLKNLPIKKGLIK